MPIQPDDPKDLRKTRQQQPEKVLKPDLPPAEKNVAEELEAEHRKPTPSDKQRAFGGPDFAKIPEDLPGHAEKVKEEKGKKP